MPPRKRVRDFGDESITSKDDPNQKSSGKGTPRNLAGGLRLFTDLVCKKLRTEGSICSNDIAERLIIENGGDPSTVDDNIRRRCYDALNVLLAVGIARKDGKYIKYTGGESQRTDTNELKDHIATLKEEIVKKRESIKQLIRNTIALDRLIAYNSQLKEENQDKNKYMVPFLIVSTSSDTTVQVEMSKKQNEMLFTMNNQFELHDSNDILHQLGFDRITDEQKQSILSSPQLQYIPPSLLQEALNECPSCPPSSSYPTLYPSTLFQKPSNQSFYLLSNANTTFQKPAAYSQPTYYSSNPDSGTNTSSNITQLSTTALAGSFPTASKHTIEQPSYSDSVEEEKKLYSFPYSLSQPTIDLSMYQTPPQEPFLDSNHSNPYMSTAQPKVKNMVAGESQLPSTPGDSLNVISSLSQMH